MSADGPADRLRFAFSGSRMLVIRSEERARVPRASDLEETGVTALAEHGLTPDTAALELPEPFDPPGGMELLGLRALHGALAEATFALAGRAFQLVDWGKTSRFCGRCGSPTRRSDRELAMECTMCGRAHFPRISPAVIVRITREPGEILLGRSHRAPDGCYSVLAGFVEPGESLEEAVAREIHEEVGVTLAHIRYFGSQPWPFPDSLMIGFTAKYLVGELAHDTRELAHAGWFAPDALPPVPPVFSIARALIDDFVTGCGLDPSKLAEWPV